MAASKAVDMVIGTEPRGQGVMGEEAVQWVCYKTFKKFGDERKGEVLVQGSL